MHKTNDKITMTMNTLDGRPQKKRFNAQLVLFLSNNYYYGLFSEHVYTKRQVMAYKTALWD